MKKVLASLLAMGMVVSLAACGNAESKTAGEATADNPVDLTMWCIATESDSNRHAY